MNHMPFQRSAFDNEELIHEAVRQGHRISLEIYLNQNPECLNKVYTYNRSKWTPLLAACYYKHEDIVRMLLRRFQPDIEAKGTVVFDMVDSQPEMVEDVSPLWTAAAVDHFNIVQLLIEQGQANVNCLTKTHSTCFRVACYNNNLNLAKYLIEHGANPYQMKIGNYTNLMLSAGRRYPTIVKYLVNELNSNINEQDENGQTALYYAIKSGSIEIIQFLLEHGALNIRDKLRNVTPLMRAALYGEIELVQIFAGYCSDLDWIEAKELLGATFGGCVARFENFNKTIEYITEAFQLREMKNLPKILSFQPNEIFQYRSECQTMEEFNQLVHSHNEDDLRIETIRIHQRLLGDRSNDYHHVLRYYGAVLADKYRYNDCLRWWFYEIDLKHQHKIQLKKEYLRYFIDIFIEMKYHGISWENFIRILNIIDYELQSHRKDENWDYHLHTLLYIITIIARIIFKGNEEKQSINYRRELIQVIQLIIQRQYRTIQEEYSLLHLSSSSSTIRFSEELSYPCPLTVRFLLSCGIHVDSLDINRNTPLHRSMLNTSSSIDMIITIGNLLCEFGAHLDQVNNRGEIALELVPLTHHQISRYLKEKMAVRQLKCICARYIQKLSLSYQQYFSNSLVNFIEKH